MVLRMNRTLPEDGRLSRMPDPSEYLRAVPLDLSKRTRRLTAARAVLLHLRTTRKARIAP